MMMMIMIMMMMMMVMVMVVMVAVMMVVMMMMATVMMIMVMVVIVAAEHTQKKRSAVHHLHFSPPLDRPLFLLPFPVPRPPLIPPRSLVFLLRYLSPHSSSS